MTYTGIMQLENILKVTEVGGKFARDPIQYRFSIFGEPSATGTWGWRVEGHHISLHFTIVKGAMIPETYAAFGAWDLDASKKAYR